MPFQKGNKLGGRKAYVLEQKQVKRMQKILDNDLKIMEELQMGEVDASKKEKLILLQARVLKIMDKLHATKESHEHSGEISLPTPILDNLKKNE